LKKILSFFGSGFLLLKSVKRAGEKRKREIHAVYERKNTYFSRFMQFAN